MKRLIIVIATLLVLFSLVSPARADDSLQVYYAGNEEGLYYFAMEYIDGLDLSQVLARYANDAELMPHEDVLPGMDEWRWLILAWQWTFSAAH